MTREELEQLQRYERLLAEMLRTTRPLSHSANEQPYVVPLDHGIGFSLSVVDPARFSAADMAQQLMDIAETDKASRTSFVDADGHQRSTYRGLLIHSWARSAYVVDGSRRWDKAIDAWSVVLQENVWANRMPSDKLAASAGSKWAGATWDALAMDTCGDLLHSPQLVEEAQSCIFEPLLAAQQKHGPFLKSSGNDNLESLWYHELVILHALASYGATWKTNVPMREAVFRATEYHQNETQPDHATNDPWGLFAFIWNPQTRLLADGMLHAVSTMSRSVGPVTLMLLADALYCVRQLLTTNQDKP